MPEHENATGQGMMIIFWRRQLMRPKSRFTTLNTGTLFAWLLFVDGLGLGFTWCRLLRS
jgi:hypothetical protein